VFVALPAVGGREEKRLRDDLDAAGIDRRHDVVAVEPPDILGLMSAQGLDVTSMGRPAAADPILFQSAAAAGTLAARQ
jgi:hypothetical protein